MFIIPLIGFKRKSSLWIYKVAGKKNSSFNNSFDELYQKDFCDDFGTLYSVVGLKSTQKHNCAIAVKLNDTMPNLIANSKLKEALLPYYERVLRYFDKMYNLS